MNSRKKPLFMLMALAIIGIGIFQAVQMQHAPLMRGKTLKLIDGYIKIASMDLESSLVPENKAPTEQVIRDLYTLRQEVENTPNPPDINQATRDVNEYNRVSSLTYRIPRVCSVAGFPEWQKAFAERNKQDHE